jgi:hypothetical protein
MAQIGPIEVAVRRFFRIDSLAARADEHNG